MAEEFVQLKQHQGTFEASGVIFNMGSEHAFKDIVMKNKKSMKIANIGLRISDGESMFLTLNGMEQDNVYFSKSGAKGEKSQTEKIEWAKRNRFNKEGFRLIGVSLALAKGEDGKNVAVKNFTQFDAVDEIKENLKDGVSVFVKGKIEFGSFLDEKSGELKKTVKYVPNAIYLSGKDIDFQDAKFEKSAGFAQPVLVTGLRKEDGKNLIDFGIVGYKSYEESTMEANDSLYEALKTKLKKGASITITGVIKTSQNVEVVSAEVWGEESKVGKAKSSGKVVMLATGARPETMDVETYAKKPLAEYLDAVEAFKKEKADKSASFNSQGSAKKEEWGEGSKVETEEEGW